MSQRAGVLPPGCDYTATATPDDYVCDGCRATGVKLWRLPHDAGKHLCASCSMQDQQCVGGVGPDGKMGGGDKIGDMMPAVPTPNNDTFWGYSSVPDEAVAWWKRLPLIKATRPRFPLQPLVLDGNGTVRFKQNAIVRYLIDHSNIDLNRIALVAAEHGFSQQDEEQFAQLIGYSLGGFHELSYVSDDTAKEASLAAKAAFGSDVGGCRDEGCELHSGVPRESTMMKGDGNDQ